MLDKSDKKFIRDEIKESIEEAVVQISSAINKALEGKADKADLEKLATKEDLGKVEGRLEKVESQVRWMRDDINTLKADTPTAREFNSLEKRVDKLESAAIVQASL